MSANQFQRIVNMRPAFDKRNSDPKKNYGIHGVDLSMILKGPLGAVQFVVYTNWQLPHVQEETDQRTLTRVATGTLDQIQLDVSYRPIPADVGYHSPRPMYEGQEPMGKDCEYVEGGVCYYDGSGLQAEAMFSNVLLTEGSEGVWKALEQRYKELFHQVPA